MESYRYLLQRIASLLATVFAVSLLFATGCGSDDVEDDGEPTGDFSVEEEFDRPVELTEEVCGKMVECDVFDGDVQACVEGLQSAGDNVDTNGEIEIDEDECSAAFLEHLECRNDLGCEAFLDGQLCPAEHQALIENCPAGTPEFLSEDEAIEKAEHQLCDRRLECDDDFDQHDHDICTGAADCGEAQQNFHDCRMDLTCDEFNPSGGTHGCEDELHAASGACDGEDVPVDPIRTEEYCDKALECEDAFTEEHHAICLDLPDCEDAIELFHQCEMSLDCDEYTDPQVRGVACRIERGFAMAACLDS